MLRNPSYTLSTNVGGGTSLTTCKRRQVRPRIWWKSIEWEKGGASGIPDIFHRSKSTLTLFVPLSRRSLFSNLVRTIGSWVAGTSTHQSSISVTIHPPTDIETKKLCIRVVWKALPMIDISQEDGEKGQNYIWLWDRHVVKFEGTAKVG